MKLRDLAKAVILSGSILLSPYLTNKISAGENPIKKIELFLLTRLNLQNQI